MSRRDITDIEEKAASKAINKTVGMLERKFNIKARSSNPTQRRKSIIKKLYNNLEN